MLKTIGISSLEELYSDIPREVRLNRPLKVNGFSSEQEMRSNVEQLLKENKSGTDYNSFLGAGIYNHYIPAAVKAIVSRTEFQTSYTPYQAEISQGLLQSLFEFESMIRDLTAVDAVNSSLYDGSTALGEAARMAVRATGKYKVIVPRNLHPDKLSVLRNYTEPVGIRVEDFEYDKETGGPDIDDLQAKLDHETGALYCEVPSFFGTLDADAVRIPSMCHEKGALSIIGFDPISLGGPKGLHDLFESILVKTRYAIKRHQEIPKASGPRFEAQHYQEFVVTFKRARGITSRINRKLLLAGMHGGRSLVKDFPELGESSLLCVTETQSGEAIDRFSGLMTKLLRG